MNDREQVRRKLRELWSRKGVARVTHPAYGSVVVPCGSKLSAMMCTAAVWGCHWFKTHDAEVWAAEPGEMPVPLPMKFR